MWTLRRLDFLKCRIENADLPLNGGGSGDGNSAQIDQWAHIQGNRREELFQEVKQDLLVGHLVLAVDHEALLNLHVDLSRSSD